MSQVSIHTRSFFKFHFQIHSSFQTKKKLKIIRLTAKCNNKIILNKNIEKKKWKGEEEVGTGCLLNMFRCENGPCIDQRFRCDGINDCPYDTSDELDCHTNRKSLFEIPTTTTNNEHNFVFFIGWIFVWIKGNFNQLKLNPNNYNQVYLTNSQFWFNK